MKFALAAIAICFATSAVAVSPAEEKLSIDMMTSKKQSGE